MARIVGGFGILSDFREFLAVLLWMLLTLFYLVNGRDRGGGQ